MERAQVNLGYFTKENFIVKTIALDSDLIMDVY